MSTKRRNLFLILLPMLLANVAFWTGGSAQAATSSELRNYGNQKCMDSASEDFGKINPKIQIWGCSGAREQQWESIAFDGHFFIENELTHQCLGAPSDYPFQRSLSTDPCGDRATDYWNVAYANNTGKGWYQVWRNNYNGLCIDLTNNSSTNGTLIQQAPCDLSFTDKAQQWQFV